MTSILPEFNAGIRALKAVAPQYAPAVGVKMNDNSSSTTHVGSVGSSMYLSGEALLDELRRAGVL